MKLRDIVANLNILSATADMDTEIGGVSYDSRNTQPGDLFVAVKGFSSDGHRYIGTALKKGAAAVLCEDIPQDAVPFVQVANTREGLALASRALFGDPAAGIKVVGITGTNGKTTSSYILKHMLEREFGAKVGLVGTNGNMIGAELLHTERTTPESYELYKLFRRMADEGCSYIVMEVSSHSLALDRVAGIHFETAVFTNLTQDHLDFHGTMENYAAAKKLLFSRCGAVCMNADDAWYDYMMDGVECRTVNFSAEGREAELSATDIVLTAEGVSFTANYGGQAVPVRLAIPGMFSVHNGLGVMAAGLSLGLSLTQCADAIDTAQGVKGRMERVPTGGGYSVLIDYSHTPDALENALKTLKPLTRGRLIALFGCGGDRDHTKRPVMGEVGARLSDVCIVTSDNPRTEDPDAIIRDILTGTGGGTAELKVITDRIEAIHCALDIARQGDVILLAGKGHEDYQEINHVKHHMDEREIVAEYLQNRAERGC